jgi:putative ABC transport system permease protein
VVLGSTVAAEAGLKVGDSIKIQPWIGKNRTLPEVSLRVSGILLSTGSQWDRTLFSSIPEAHRVFEQNFSALADKSIWGPQVLHYFLVYLRPNGFAPFEALVNRRTVGQVVKVEDQKERLREISGAGRSIGLFVTTFVILLGGLSVCSMLITRFEGMSLQLAVLRALGYTSRELSKWLLWEGLLLGAMGVVLGALIDSIALPILRSLLGSALPPSDLVSSSVFDSAVIWIMAMVAIVASVSIPMVRMSRQDTHDSLKGL